MKTRHQTVQKTLTAGQMKELVSAVAEGIPVNLSQETAQYWIGKKKKLAKEISRILVSQDGNPYIDLLQDWQNFYHDLFSIDVENDFSELIIPAKPEGFDRLLVLIKGMKPQRLYDKCGELFRVWKWTEKNLDEVIISDRSAKNSAYAIWIRDRVEADEELKNLSATDLKNQNILGIILEERLIYELKYFKETGKHLDIDNWTLCAGSRCDDGSVPSVSWDPGCGEMVVGWCDPDDRHGLLRARQAVS